MHNNEKEWHQLLDFRRARFERPLSNRQRARPTAEYKTFVCGIALLAAAHGTPIEYIEFWIGANFRVKWTVVNATQYLGGSEAEMALSRLDGVQFLGIESAELHPVIALARDVASGKMAQVEVLRRLQQEAPRLGDAAALAAANLCQVVAGLIVATREGELPEFFRPIW